MDMVLKMILHRLETDKHQAIIERTSEMTNKHHGNRYSTVMDKLVFTRVGPCWIPDIKLSGRILTTRFYTMYATRMEVIFFIILSQGTVDNDMGQTFYQVQSL